VKTEVLKTCLSATFFTTNPTWSGMDWTRTSTVRGHWLTT